MVTSTLFIYIIFKYHNYIDTNQFDKRERVRKKIFFTSSTKSKGFRPALSALLSLSTLSKNCRAGISGDGSNFVSVAKFNKLFFDNLLLNDEQQQKNKNMFYF